MKIRVTLLTENDVDVDALCKEKNVDREYLENQAKLGWDTLAKLFVTDSENKDKCYVEKVELLD